jgi:hypothetical protein
MLIPLFQQTTRCSATGRLSWRLDFAGWTIATDG